MVEDRNAIGSTGALHGEIRLRAFGHIYSLLFLP
jgi:hypothetical protein